MRGMSKQKKLENLVKVKNELADKYIRLAKAVNSRPRRKSLMHRAEHHRRQAVLLEKKLA
jgi:hypothetical protein